MNDTINTTQTFNIYRYGKLDRSYALRRDLKAAGRVIAAKSLHIASRTFDGLDELVVAFKAL